ncbi:MAG: thiamine pyrophosphate-binding protein [Pseudomonadota bacterium]
MTTPQDTAAEGSVQDHTTAGTGAAAASGADRLARVLYDLGVRHAFGIPGGEVLALIEALGRAGIAFHLARHENAAGFMAEAAWHATGAPAVLVATVGPGIANAFNVIANAEQDRVPLIALSGMVDAAEAARYTHQVFDHGLAMRAVCKASLRLEPGAVAVQAAKAVRLAMAPRPGPVHLDLPISVATGAEPAGPATLPAAPPLPAPAPGPAWDAAAALFATAERPVILAGLDVLAEPDGPGRLRAFAERHAVPVATTYKAKGVLPEDHPLALGGHGLSPKADRLILPVLGDADCVLALGYDPIEMRAGWRDPWDPARCLEIAHAANAHDMHAAAHSFLGSVVAGLAALDSARTVPAAPWHRAARTALDRSVAPGPGWGADRAIAELLAALPAEAVATVDSGAHRILLSQHFFCTRPRQLLQSTGLCTMGCALPLALGHAIAEPGRPAVAFMGDGCAEMVLGELATLRDATVAGTAGPVVAVVFVDASLALIEMKQRRDQRPNAGVDYGAPTDFVALARVFGGEGFRVEAPGEAAPALAAALAARPFAVVEVALPRRAYDGLI